MIIINNITYANCSCPHGETVITFNNLKYYCMDTIQCCDENNKNCIQLNQSKINQIENNSKKWNNKNSSLWNNINDKSINNSIASKNQDNLFETNKVTQNTNTKVPINNVDNKNTKINNKSSNGLKNNNKVQPITSNSTNTNNTLSIKSSSSAIPTIHNEGIISNSNNVIDNSKNSIPSENENFKNGVKDSSHFSYFLTIGFTVLGMALTVFFIIKKYKKRNNNEEFQELEYEEDLNYLHSILKDELKDPKESCEEYLNSLSRLRYKDPIYESYNPNKSYQQFSYFKESPVLAPSIIHSIENISQTDLQPIMINSQFENSNLSSIQIDQSYSTKDLCRIANRDSNFSLKKMDASSLRITTNNDYSPLLNNDSFLSSPITPNGDISMNLSIVDLSYNPASQQNNSNNPASQQSNSSIEENEEKHQY